MSPEELCENLNRLMDKFPDHIQAMLYSHCVKDETGYSLLEPSACGFPTVKTPLDILNELMALMNPGQHWRRVVPIYRSTEIAGFRVVEVGEDPEVVWW